MAYEEYWKGYADAIKQADAVLCAKGDDVTIRGCRQAILALIKEPFDTHAAEWQKPRSLAAR